MARQGSAKDSAGGVVEFPRIHNWARANPMDRADLYRVYEFGGAIKCLPFREGVKAAEIFGPLFTARLALEALLGQDPQAKVDVCLPAAREFKAALDALYNEYFHDKEKNEFKYTEDAKTREVAEWDLWGPRAALQNFEAVFRADMQIAATYWVPQRGAYGTRDLVDHFERSFLPDLMPSIGMQALKEYRSAGRCFAFGLWTAAGYHSCRAVEAVLRPYFCLLTDQEDKESRTWGNLIEELERSVKTPKASDKTLFYLRQIKDNERNPLMHVRIVLDEQDADLLLSSAKNVIVMMAREIDAIKNPKEAPSIASAFKVVEGGVA
jgi:hypothetical protein